MRDILRWALAPALLIIAVSAQADQTVITQQMMPQNWSSEPAMSQTSPVDDAWWRSFDDATLDSLITLGVNNNYDVAMAMRRMAAAKNALNAAKGAYYPTIGLNGSWSASRSSGVTTKERSAAMNERAFDLGLSASWEIDLFGKITSGVKSKDALYKASKAEYDGAMVAMAAQIASAYIELRMYQAQLALANDHRDRQAKVVAITEARHEAGIGNALEVAQAKVVLYSTEASLPQLDNSINQSINSIAVLVGMFPQQIKAMLDSTAPLPDYRQLVSAGIPADLLRRRPDIAEAEMQLRSYAAELGVAQKEFLPTLTIEGQIGTASRRFDGLFTDPSLTYSVTPTLSWTLFDGFARKNNVAAQRRQVEIGIDNYNQTVLTAFEEVDNAMNSYYTTLREIDRLDEVVSQSEKAMTLSLDLYKQGLTAFSNVVDAQIDLLQYEESLIQSKAQALTALIDLYEALGGGF